MDKNYALIPHNHDEASDSRNKKKLDKKAIENILLVSQTIIEYDGEVYEDQYWSAQRLLHQMKQDLKQITSHNMVKKDQELYCETEKLIKDYDRYMKILNQSQLVNLIDIENYLKVAIVKIQCQLGLKPSYDSAIIFLTHKIKAEEKEERRKQKIKVCI